MVSKVLKKKIKECVLLCGCLKEFKVQSQWLLLGKKSARL